MRSWWCGAAKLRPCNLFSEAKPGEMNTIFTRQKSWLKKGRDLVGGYAFYVVMRDMESWLNFSTKIGPKGVKILLVVTRSDFFFKGLIGLFLASSKITRTLRGPALKVSLKCRLNTPFG